MTWRVTILMLMIAGVLAFLAIVTMDRSGASGAMRGSRPLLESERFPLAELNHIELVRGGASWSYSREGDGWWQVEPFRAAVSDRHMQILAERATDLTVIDRFVPDTELSEEALRLDPPEASLSFTWPGGARRFSLGRRGVGGRGYLRMGESQNVLVVSQGLHALVMDSDPTTWREPRLFPGFDIDYRRIRRSVVNENMTLERDGRAWRFTDPISTRTDREAMEDYVIELARAKSAGVILDEPDSLSAFGLDNPLAIVEVENQEGVTRKLLVGDRVGGRTQDRYAMIDGTPSVLRVEARSIATLLSDPISLVDPRATGMPRSSIKALVIRGSAEDIRLERDLDRWIAPLHGGAEVPRARVESLLDLLIETPGTEIAIVDTYPVDLEVGSITLIGYDRMPMDTVRVLRESEADGFRWGLENGDRIVRIHPSLIEIPMTSGEWGLPAP